MACNSSILEGGPLVVWTSGGAAIYHAFSAPLESASVVSVRQGTFMANRTANCGVSLAVRYSNDGINWDAWVDVTNAPVQSADGWSYDTVWRTLTAGTLRRFVQLGFKATATGGSTVTQLCAMSWRVEARDT